MVGVDLDDVIDDAGEMIESAKMIVAALDTYTEVSPSGKGVKALAFGHLAEKMTRIDHARGVEMYDGAETNRYFAITGQRLPGSPADLRQARDALHGVQSLLSEPLDSSVLSGGEGDPGTIQEARDLLSHLSEDRARDYFQWINVGMALHSVDSSEEMLAVWDEWSQGSEKYDGPDATRSKWESFRREDGRLVTIGTLRRYARQDGYRPGRFSLSIVFGGEFVSRVIERTYLCDHMLVEGEPMIIGGASKALKTSVAIDLAVSLATGTAFLGRVDKFVVSEPKRVLVLSGESGDKTIQSTLRSIMSARGLAGPDLGRLAFGFDLPKLDTDDLDVLVDAVREHLFDVVFIDPLYLSFAGVEDVGNVYAMGNRLLRLRRLIQASATPIILHHFRKQGKSWGEQPELEDLSQAGVAEFGRQFILLKRQEQYQFDGNHKLWMLHGGSAGHQGMGSLGVFTGTSESGLEWRASYQTLQEQKQSERDAKEMDTKVEEDELREEVINFVNNNPGSSQRAVRDGVSGKDEKISETIHKLIKEGVLVNGASPTAKGWKLRLSG